MRCMPWHSVFAKPISRDGSSSMAISDPGGALQPQPTAEIGRGADCLLSGAFV